MRSNLPAAPGLDARDRHKEPEFAYYKLILFSRSSGEAMFSQVTQSGTFLRCIALNSPRKGWHTHPLRVRFQVFDNLVAIDVTHFSQNPTNCRLNVVSVVIEAVR